MVGAFGEFTKNTIQGASLEGSQLSSFTFPGGGINSDPIETWGRAILSLYLPASVLGASWQIYGAYDNNGVPSTFFPYLNIAGEPVGTQVITAELPCVVGLTPIEILGLNYIKFVSNVPETASPVIYYTFRNFK